jgi:L-2,4-diaminobutyric acid acetyltransferase
MTQIDSKHTLAPELLKTPPPHFGQAGFPVYDSGVVIRAPKPEDIRGIVAVVRACEPYLTAHTSYVYWRDIRCFSRTCAVAELRGEIVGWGSMVPASGAKYFLHQLAVARAMRRKGVGEAIVDFQLDLLRRQHGAVFELEFTVDRSNAGALNLMQGIAERFGMQLLKSTDSVRLSEEACAEELYTMTAAHGLHGEQWKNDASGYTFEV